MVPHPLTYHLSPLPSATLSFPSLVWIPFFLQPILFALLSIYPTTTVPFYSFMIIGVDTPRGKLDTQQRPHPQRLSRGDLGLLRGGGSLRSLRGILSILRTSPRLPLNFADTKFYSGAVPPGSGCLKHVLIEPSLLTSPFHYCVVAAKKIKISYFWFFMTGQLLPIIYYLLFIIYFCLLSKYK